MGGGWPPEGGRYKRKSSGLKPLLQENWTPSVPLN